MNSLRHCCLLLIWICPGSWCAAADFRVTETGCAQHDKTGVKVVSGTLALPAEGYWSVPDPFGLEGGITQIFLDPPSVWHQRQQGQRLLQAREEETTKRGRYPLSTLYHLLLDYAREHDGVGPAVLEDLPDQTHYAVKRFGESPYEKEFHVSGPPYALLPRVVFDLAGATLRVNQTADPTLLAVELRPYFDDAKHWVLYTSGVTRRVDVDRALMAELHLEVTALQKKTSLSDESPDAVLYRIYGLQRNGIQGPVRFRVQNSQTQAMLDCLWQPTETSVDQPVIKTWAEKRAQAWREMTLAYDAPTLKQWTVIQQRLYGSEGMPRTRNRRGLPNPNRQISSFGVLGGQAAMQETFQLQGLQIGADATGQTSVPVDDIEGVQVKSHPFKAMRGEQAGGHVPLADVVPEDCLFVHFPRPKAAAAFLGQGSSFVSHLGSMSLGRSLNYGIVTQYLARLGLTQDMLDQLLRHGSVQEFAVMMPDLFLIDGTEVTVAARVPQIQGLVSLLRMMGLGRLSQGQVLEVATAGGRKAYWGLDGDLVFISTHRALLNQSLTLRRNQGMHSLGQSDEFQYMLTQLPETPSTRCYVYFSDPFIRALVSPATKIAQLRRLQARVHMNLATHAALLSQLDHQSGTPTVEGLMALGYLPDDFPKDDIQLDPGLKATSKADGAGHQLRSWTEKPVTLATAREAEAYKQYVTAYRRYWRQYFDPVAVRLDDAPDHGLALTTFILPLLESQMYEQIRRWVPGEQGLPLRLPRIEPAPVAVLSLNLTDKIWGGMVSQFLRSMAGSDTTFVDQLGPALHVAIQDADPVLAFGGGDLLGLVGQVGGMNDMMMIPLVVSVLTRPCAILIETQDPEGLRRFLGQNGLAGMFSRFDNDFRVETYRVAGRDAWVLSIDLLGLAKMRFGIEVQDDYLILTNQPWSQQLTIQGTVPSPLSHMSLSLEPAAAQQQWAAMFTSAAEKQRRSALQGSAMLLPLLWTGSKDVTGATDRHQALFGFVPTHPGEGAWILDPRDTLVSTDFGSLEQPLQPALREGQSGFGLLQGISQVDVSLQIEDTGLRTRIYWKMTPSLKPEAR
ncbi:MAG: hypothetical protein GY809_02455 [Planctomycetes bacterium]|nr:hypothetical protein [Planctomycetota bacterium]